MLLDLNKIFKKRDRDWNAKHDECFYVWKYKGRIYYIGHGKFTMEFWWNSRPFHLNCFDMLANTIDEDWTCEILYGLTEREAAILESYAINLSKKSLSKKGSYVWDGKSLINKRRELTYKGTRFEKLYKEYLNLKDGNNYWKTLRRQINGY